MECDALVGRCLSPGASACEGKRRCPHVKTSPLRAYEVYAQVVPGDAEAHWLAAEQRLRSEAGR